jgi:hypothetical protein
MIRSSSSKDMASTCRRSHMLWNSAAMIMRLLSVLQMPFVWHAYQQPQGLPCPVLQINEDGNVRLLLENVPEVEHHADDDDDCDDDLLRPNMEEAIRSAQQVRVRLQSEAIVPHAQWACRRPGRRPACCDTQIPNNSSSKIVRGLVCAICNCMPTCCGFVCASGVPVLLQEQAALLELNDALQRRARQVMEQRNKGRPAVNEELSRLDGADARYR